MVMQMKIDVLGTEYTVEIKSREEDEFLQKCDGYCDKTSKKIVVMSESKDSELDNFEEYQKKVKRHEIIHAFLFESGLQENFKHDEWGHDETMIDWVAIQFHKLMKAFKDADCL